jgi:hypothetical protein
MAEELLDDNTELWYLGRLTEFIEREVSQIGSLF